jgi:ABC transport system ATP-binding/permease protein
VLEEEEIAAHKLDRKILDEEHWMRYGVTARRKRNMRRVGELADLRTRSREARRGVGEVDMAASLATPSGALVIEAEHVSKSYGARAIVADFSTRVLRSDRVGIVGANGAGKTTLIHLLTGELAPDDGRVRLGSNVALASLDQGRASVPPSTTLADALTGGGSEWVEVNGVRKHVIGYMRDFLFPPEQARTPIEKLSGGERGRLMLARALAQPSNLMVLDEPTNDLDIETLDLLQELLASYPGTIIVVSHDRDFLDRVATSIVVSEGDGQWREYAGGYADMVAQRGYGLTPPTVGSSEKRRALKLGSQSQSEAKRRLSFKQKHALETLPDKIAALRAELTRIEAGLANSDAHTRDPQGFRRLTEAHSLRGSQLTTLEDEWLALEMLREEIEG